MSKESKTTHLKKAEGSIMTIILVFFILTFSAMVGEFFRIHILQQDIEYQVQRAVNCAVEYAMGDSYRQDKIVSLNISLARSEFYKYLGTDMGLDMYNRKYKNGKLAYTMFFTQTNGASNPARFTVKGQIEANSLFSFLIGKIIIPFNISSTNYRLDS